MLRFPIDWYSDRLVSTEAIDLIFQLLQDKEDRLSSSRYIVNDLDSRSRDSIYWASQPECVYSNDATGIKSHPFFKGIKWGTHYTSKPPFVPKIKSVEDTQYFDACGPLDGVLDASSVSDAAFQEGSPERLDSPNPLWKPQSSKAAKASDNKPQLLNDPTKAQKEREKERLKTRPRDKILRDEQVGKVALDIRKRGAFYGYTYHRPKTPIMALHNQRGRLCVPRAQVKELFGYGYY